MINRELLQKIESRINLGKVIVLLGARQTGKTTILKEIQSQSLERVLFLNGDDSDVRVMLSNPNATKMAEIIGTNTLLIIDEAQRIENIGLTLKILHDNYRDLKIIATGSSSFELTDKINEPLTGRKLEYTLFPLSFRELVTHSSFLEESRVIEERMRYGYYPEILTNVDFKQDLLKTLADSYLYKDILNYQRIKKPEKVEKLLQALALQIGNEVSYNELGQMIGADNETVENYINILEKAYIVFRLPSLSRNVRNELKKSRKIFFYDLGIRNAVINNYNQLELRADVGALWENFLVAERYKLNSNTGRNCNYFFWRTTSQSEIDFIEERDGKIFAYEFKWNTKKGSRKPPDSFIKGYPEAEYQVISRENFSGFLLEPKPAKPPACAVHADREPN